MDTSSRGLHSGNWHRLTLAGIDKPQLKRARHHKNLARGSPAQSRWQCRVAASDHFLTTLTFTGLSSRQQSAEDPQSVSGSLREVDLTALSACSEAMRSVLSGQSANPGDILKRASERPLAPQAAALKSRFHKIKTNGMMERSRSASGIAPLVLATPFSGASIVQTRPVRPYIISTCPES